VNFAELGYLPQTVQVAIRTPEHSMFESPTEEAQPNPLAVVLQAGGAGEQAAAQAEAEIAPARHRDAGGRRAAAPGSAFPPPAALTAVPAGTSGPSWTIGGLSGTIVHYLTPVRARLCCMGETSQERQRGAPCDPHDPE